MWQQWLSRDKCTILFVLSLELPWILLTCFLPLSPDSLYPLLNVDKTNLWLLFVFLCLCICFIPKLRQCLYFRNDPVDSWSIFITTYYIRFPLLANIFVMIWPKFTMSSFFLMSLFSQVFFRYALNSSNWSNKEFKHI